MILVVFGGLKMVLIVVLRVRQGNVSDCFGVSWLFGVGCGRGEVKIVAVCNVLKIFLNLM